VVYHITVHGRFINFVLIVSEFVRSLAKGVKSVP